MANNTNAVDAVVAQSAIKQVDELIVKLSAADAELIKISESALKAGKNISSISTPSGMDKAVTSTANLNEELAKQNKQIEALQAQITKLSQVRAISNKMSAEEAVNQRILNQNALTQAKSISNLVGAYDKLNLQHQAAFKNAQNIGAQYGSTSKQFLEASVKANKLDDELKLLDSTLGKNTRNVGNYKSGYNALGNSINQLTREAPAFANSLNTGFMAISNNIPALTDAIKGIREQNNLLRAEGKPTQSVLSQLAASFFSWQTAISLGVTLLTIYGGKLVEWISGTEKQLSATEKLTEALKRQNEQIRNYNENISHQTALAIENAKQRGAAAKDIDALERKSAEDQLKNFENERDSLKRQFELAKTFREDEKAGVKDFDGNLVTRIKSRADFIEAMKLSGNEEFAILKDSLKKAESEVKKQAFSVSELVERQQTKRVEEAKKAAEDEAARKKKENEKSTKEDESAEEKRLKKILALREKFKKEFDKLSDEINSLQKDVPLKAAGIWDVDKSSKAALDALEKQQQAIEKTKKSMEELHKTTIDWLDSFSDEFFQNTGLGSLETFFDGSFNKLLAGAQTVEEKFAIHFNAIAESAQEMFNFINQNSEANFDAEKSRLESQYQISLQYAGDNKVAQEQLALELETSKKDIANREAKAKQKTAIFNIAIDTAQGIVSALASTPPNVPLSIIIGAIGAAQIAMVAAREVPQYWMGGTHDGGLMMVNDGAGSNYRETIVTPDGKITKPTGRNVIMDAPAGTEIYTPNQWNDVLFDMLQGKGISMSAHNQYGGLTKADMHDVLMDTLGSQPQYVSNFDADGATDYIIKGGNKTIINRNRGNGRGVRV